MLQEKQKFSSRSHKIDTFNCEDKSHEINGIEDYQLTANTLSVRPAMPTFGAWIELSREGVMKNNPHVFLKQDQLSEIFA